MAMKSLRGQARAKRALPAQKTHRLITFQVRQDWFGLPIQVAQKVFPPQPIYGEAPHLGIGLALIQGQKIPTLDLRTLIYQGVAPPPLLPPADPSETDPAPPKLLPERHILMAELPQMGSVGLLIDGQPVLRRAPESAFAAISPVYLIMNNIECVDTVVSLTPEEPPIFMLRLEKLLPTVRSLPSPA